MCPKIPPSPCPTPDPAKATGRPEASDSQASAAGRGRWLGVDGRGRRRGSSESANTITPGRERGTRSSRTVCRASVASPQTIDSLRCSSKKVTMRCRASAAALSWYFEPESFAITLKMIEASAGS